MSTRSSDKKKNTMTRIVISFMPPTKWRTIPKKSLWLWRDTDGVGIGEGMNLMQTVLCCCSVGLHTLKWHGRATDPGVLEPGSLCRKAADSISIKPALCSVGLTIYLEKKKRIVFKQRHGQVFIHFIFQIEGSIWKNLWPMCGYFPEI